MNRFTAAAVALGMAIFAAVPATAATADRTKPRVAFTTADNAVLLGAPLAPALPEPIASAMTVTGTATDIRGRGIRKVTVTFCANATPDSCGSGVPTLTGVVTTRAASVGCTTKTRQRCVWSTPAPATPGTYLVTATAEDLAGNRRSVGPIFVTVL